MFIPMWLLVGGLIVLYGFAQEIDRRNYRNDIRDDEEEYDD